MLDFDLLGVTASIAAFAASAALTRLILRYALNRNLVDAPNARSSHVRPTPRGGGLAIVIAGEAGVLLALAAGWIPVAWCVVVAIAGLALATIGWIDDHGHVHARWRLLVHLAAALLLVALIGAMPLAWLGLGSIALAAEFAISVIGVVWLINLFNFMDGIDGIAGSEAVFVMGGFALCAALAGAAAGPAWLAVVLAAATGGFLCWNWPPAKIFMGDVGSGFLGAILAALVLIGSQFTPQLGVAVMILAGIFGADATVAVLRRAANRMPLSEAHCSHAFQRVGRRWGAHRPVTLSALAINMLFLLPVALLTAGGAIAPLAGAMAAYVPLVTLAWLLGSGRPDVDESAGPALPPQAGDAAG